MKVLLSIAALVILSGCATTKTEVLVEHRYITRTASAAQKEIPPYPPKIETTMANQIDLAKWIRDSEQRTERLEAIIIELVKFYEAPATEADKK